MVIQIGNLLRKPAAGWEQPAHPDTDQYVAEIEREKLPPLLSPKRVAGLLDMDKRRIYDLVATGDLAGVRHGTRGLRIFRQSLIDWLRKGGSSPAKHREIGRLD